MAKKEGTPNQGEALQKYLKQPPASLMGLHRQIWPTSWPIPAAPSHMVLQRGTPAGLLSHCWPTPSTCWMMYCTFKRGEQCNGPSTLCQGCNGYALPKVILETEVSHCQNEIDTSEAIGEIKAWYAATIGEAKATYGTAIRKPEAICLASTSEAEVTQATGIRKAKAANAA